MRKPLVICLVLAASVGLAGCGDDTEEPPAVEGFSRCAIVNENAFLPDGRFPDACEIRTADEHGDEVKLETKTFDEFGYPLTEQESMTEGRRRWVRTYYAPGLQATSTVDIDGDGQFDRAFQYVVDDLCVTTEALVDVGADGNFNGGVEYSHDDHNNLLGQRFDYDGNGDLELETEFTYNSVDNPTQANIYVGGSSEIFAQITYSYDADNNLVLETTNEPFDEHINERIVYDADARKIEEEVDEDDDGAFDIRVVYQHDEFGNIERGDRFYADGSNAGFVQYKYDCLAGWQRPDVTE